MTGPGVESICPRCGARYCGTSFQECRARLGSVLVPGEGYVPRHIADLLEKQGRKVQWNDVGWED